MWYVFRDKELLGYVHAPSLYQAKVLAYKDFGNDVTLKKSKTNDR
jgi:hypothetical protein